MEANSELRWRATHAAMASTRAPLYVALTGLLPEGTHGACANFVGLYKRRRDDVNGKPAYSKVGDAGCSLWVNTTASGAFCWLAGRNLGHDGGSLQHIGDPFIRNNWQCANLAVKSWVAAPNLRAIALAAHDDDEVTVIATSTPETRNAEKRKHALDLELFEPKRAKTPSAELETIVAKRRSVLTPAVDKRAVEIVQPDFELFVAKKIDAAELESRTASARQAAEAEDARLSALDAAHEKYRAAVAARAAAEEAEDAAEAELRKLLPAEAGPSGVVKSEA